MTNHKSVEAGKIESDDKQGPKLPVQTGGDAMHRSKKEMYPWERLELLQEKLYCKAKQERNFKFYVLYDKIFVPYVIEQAYYKVKRNGGAPGVDGVTFAMIEEEFGLGKFLLELREDLRKQTYEPKAVRRKWIEKENGNGLRPLGIPTIRDRVAQMACLQIIEPIFEADFKDSSYGFRPKRGARNAMAAIKEYLREGRTEVFDADLSAYFDTIPHDKLMKTLELRISDPRVLNLIRKWLKSPVYEDGQYHKSKGEGTPQGGVISPLLANVYMHLVDRIVNNSKSLFHQAGIKIVRYADDFVLMGKRISLTVIEELKRILDKMGLKLNETKTRQIDATKESFNFLGFTVRYDRDIKGRSNKYWNIEASDKSEKKVRKKINDYLAVRGHFPAPEIAKGLNAILRGWLNYYDIPGVSYPAMNKRKLHYYLTDRLYRYYNRKSQRRSRLYGPHAFEVLVTKHKLINPMTYFVKSKLR